MSNPLTTTLLANKWPTLKIENVNGNVGYLMPFRFYKFQVCGTEDGEWDLGSTEPIKDLMLNAVKYNEPMVAKCILLKEACRALNAYMSGNYGFVPDRKIAFTAIGEPQYTYYIVNYVIPGEGNDFDEFFKIEDLDGIREFIEKCYQFIVDYYHINVA